MRGGTDLLDFDLLDWKIVQMVQNVAHPKQILTAQLKKMWPKSGNTDPNHMCVDTA